MDETKKQGLIEEHWRIVSLWAACEMGGAAARVLRRGGDVDAELEAEARRVGAEADEMMTRFKSFLEAL